MHSDFNISSSSLFSASSSSQSGYVISSRMSSTSYQSVGIVSSRDVENANSYSVKGTTSFMAIHSEVSESVTVQSAQPTIVHQRSSGRGPGGNSSGMLTPAGDMLLPMLAMACAYVIFKLFRNRKTSQTL
jgi:hypothetical protein